MTFFQVGTGSGFGLAAIGYETDIRNRVEGYTLPLSKNLRKYPLPQNFCQKRHFFFC